VTFALVVIRRFPAKKMWHYIPAQMLGGFIGAALVYFFDQAKFAVVDPQHLHTAGIFTTFPAVPQYFPGLMAEVIATAVLLFGILVIIEYYVQENAPASAPVVIGILIVGIGMSLGGMHGYAMNPARDLSPRIFVAFMGFKNNGLTDGSLIWTQAVLGSLIGGPLGAVLYHYTLGAKSWQKNISSP
jgi:glycerol uptake facilitator protein